MASVFFIRHQSAGVMHEYPFAKYPDAEQIAAVSKLCFQREGFGHRKTPNEPYWIRIVEVPLLDAEVPAVPDTELTVVSVAGVGDMVADAKGEVTPAGE